MLIAKMASKYVAANNFIVRNSTVKSHIPCTRTTGVNHFLLTSVFLPFVAVERRRGYTITATVYPKEVVVAPRTLLL